ncbi:hypothetical protein NITHO_2030007 [Nitrolancea hollandica Lb]|uniref:Uncharacterized protein n=1 Tax=Nitrolancea hollandica Lb TaxID=1129897 RepID=I4EEV3_9BACT|nr:hypothetical protein NITHO_2030007 [Nitrolancea hollandica Lb]
MRVLVHTAVAALWYLTFLDNSFAVSGLEVVTATSHTVHGGNNVVDSTNNAAVRTGYHEVVSTAFPA